MQGDNNNQALQQPLKKQGVAIAYTTGPGEMKEYARTLPLCNKCKFHHNGQCTIKCINCKRVGHLTRDCRSPAAIKNDRNLTCYECRNQGHYRKTILVKDIHKPYAASLMVVQPGKDITWDFIDIYFSEDYSILSEEFEDRSDK
nr:reverse transcriptase domain-containing protein [Tanacetum cinerariifolium]